MYTLSIENIVTWALLKRPEGINIPFLKDLSSRINPYIKEGYVDIESKSLWSLLDWSDMFKWDEKDENKIVFMEKYNSRLKDIEDNLVYRLPSYLAKLYYNLDYEWIEEEYNKENKDIKITKQIIQDAEKRLLFDDDEYIQKMYYKEITNEVRKKDLSMQTKITLIKDCEPKNKYPEVPFTTRDQLYVYMVVKNTENKYCSINLTQGYIPSNESFEGLDEYFKKCINEKIVESEIIIKEGI